MFNRIYLIGSVWEKPKAFELSKRCAITFLLAVFAKQKKCGLPPHEIGDWYSVVAEDDLGQCCDRNLKRGYLVYVEGKVQPASNLFEQNKYPTPCDNRCHVFADSVIILSKDT